MPTRVLRRLDLLALLLLRERLVVADVVHAPERVREDADDVRALDVGDRHVAEPQPRHVLRVPAVALEARSTQSRPGWIVRRSEGRGR